jgi:phosphoribosylformimino-5-aminoimidazole carboxamide ribotide isomerase
VTDIRDVKAIAELEKFGVTGMIIGKAIYEGTLSLEEAVAIVKSLR